MNLLLALVVFHSAGEMDERPPSLKPVAEAMVIYFGGKQVSQEEFAKMLGEEREEKKAEPVPAPG